MLFQMRFLSYTLEDLRFWARQKFSCNGDYRILILNALSWQNFSFDLHYIYKSVDLRTIRIAYVSHISRSFDIRDYWWSLLHVILRTYSNIWYHMQALVVESLKTEDYGFHIFERYLQIFWCSRIQIFKHMFSEYRYVRRIVSE